MEFYRNLYVSESLEKKKDKIIKKLKAGKSPMNCCVIMLTENPENQLEFFNSILLWQKYGKENPFIIGIAGCYEEALEVIQKITEETYSHRKDADIRSYILEQQGS